MPTPAQPIDLLPDPPSTQDTANFDARADAQLEAQQAMVPQINAALENVYENAFEAFNSANSAAASAASAAATSGYAGPWSSLTGALAIPASVTHDGAVWVLVSSLADVADEEPGISALWVRAYPQRRLPIFDPVTDSLLPFSNGELAVNGVFSMGLTVGALTNIVALGSVLLAYQPTTSASVVATSGDGGRTWVLRTLPATGLFTVVTDGVTFLAIPSGGTSFYSSADGVTWSTVALGDTFASTQGLRAFSGAGGLAGAMSNAGGLFMRSGSAWTVPETLPVTQASVEALFQSGGKIILKTNTAATHLQTSTTGLTGSWSGVAFPDGLGAVSRTLVQDFDGSLLAYASGAANAHVWRTADGGATWTDLGHGRLRAAAALRRIAGMALHGLGDGGGAFSRHGGQWVPRELPFSLTGEKMSAKVGNAHVLVSGGYAAVIDATATDAAKGLWE